MIDKVEERPESLATAFKKTISCSCCGKSGVTLRRLRDVEGNKTKPAEYICTKCQE